MSNNLTEITATVVKLDTLMSCLGACVDGVISITLHPAAFDALLAEGQRDLPTPRSNRLELAGIIIRKGVAPGRGDGDQPEIKRVAQ